MKKYEIISFKLKKDDEVLEFVDEDTLQLVSFTKKDLYRLAETGTVLESRFHFMTQYDIDFTDNEISRLAQRLNFKYQSNGLLKQSYALEDLLIFIEDSCNLHLWYDNKYYLYEDCNPSSMYIKDNILNIYTDWSVVYFSLGGKLDEMDVTLESKCEVIENEVSKSEFRKRLLFK